MGNFRVFLALCHSDSDICRTAVRILSTMEPPLNVAGRKVFLKVNLMKGGPPEKALNTHPEVVRGVIRWVKSRGGKPSFGDSSGIPGHTIQAAEAAGYLELAEEEGAPFVNLDAGDFVSQKFITGRFGRFWVSRAVVEADIRITIPKLKTHTLMGLSGALKNQMGLLPGGTKARLHVKASPLRALTRAILEINRLVPFHAGILDGTMVLEGGGSRKGHPRWVGCLAAGQDLLALDLAACELMKWNPGDVLLFSEAERMGWSRIHQDEIQWSGDWLSQEYPPFQRPGWDFKRVPWISKIIYGLRERSFTPEHHTLKCIGCGTCEKICPTEAIRRKTGSWINRDRCVWCFACTSHCPEHALVPRAQWYLKPFLKSRAQGVDLQ